MSKREEAKRFVTAMIEVGTISRPSAEGGIL
jgi:hypothetical protein